MPSCSPTLLADCCWHSSSCKDRTRRSARWKPVPAAAADLETANDAEWETKYGDDAPLEFGMSAIQGPRETMEDFASVIPEGRCGFLVACEPSIHEPLPCATSSVPSHADRSLLQHVLSQLLSPALPACLTWLVALCAALFDGHGTGAAADRLNDSLYDEFSHAIDDQMLNTMEDLDSSEISGTSVASYKYLHMCLRVGMARMCLSDAAMS